MKKLQPKFQEIWGIFGIWENFCAKDMLFLPVRHTTWRALFIGSSKWKKVYIFVFFIKIHDCWCMTKKFGQVLCPQEVKNTQKMTSLPLFWHTESSLGRLKFWRGKWHPNLKIILGLESIQAYLSKKHTWAQFGLREVPQNQLQHGTTHRESGAAHRRFLPIFHHSAQKFAQFWLVFLFDLTIELAWCNLITMM